MKETDLALVTGHLEGWRGWHFTLKRKVSPKIHFPHCTAYTYNKTIYHPPIWEVLGEARMLVPDAMSTAQWTLVAGWTLLLNVTRSSWFWTLLPSVQGHHMSHWLNSWSKYHSISSMWLVLIKSLINGHHDLIWTELGMWVHVFLAFVHELHIVCCLQDSWYIGLDEQAAIFLYICIHNWHLNQTCKREIPAFK